MKRAPHPGSQLPHLGTYHRVLPVSLERLYENALDWAHLPHLHAASFASIECVSADAGGWRARVRSAEGDAFEVELLLDRTCRRWITRTLAGTNAGSEVWTHAFAMEPRRTDVVVDFFAPNVPAEAREKVGSAFADLYRRLYDEDESMMVERQRMLDQRIEMPRVVEPLRLGRRTELRLPLSVDFAGRSWVIVEVQGALVAYAARCPHMLGPLARAPLAGSEVVCPWHGYRFDVLSGACTSGSAHRLPAAPAVIETDGIVTLQRV